MFAQGSDRLGRVPQIARRSRSLASSMSSPSRGASTSGPELDRDVCTTFCQLTGLGLKEKETAQSRFRHAWPPRLQSHACRAHAVAPFASGVVEAASL